MVVWHFDHVFMKRISNPCLKTNEVKVKVRSYMAQYPIFTTAQSALHITSLVDLFNQTPSQLLWEASSHAAINARRLLIQISTTVYTQVLIHTAE